MEIYYAAPAEIPALRTAILQKRDAIDRRGCCGNAYIEDRVQAAWAIT